MYLCKGGIINFTLAKKEKMKNTTSVLMLLLCILISCEDNRFNVPWFYMSNSSECTISNIFINSVDGGEYTWETVINSYGTDFIKVPSKAYNSVSYTCTCEGQNKDYKQGFTPIKLEQFEKYKILLDCSNNFIEQVRQIK